MGEKRHFSILFGFPLGVCKTSKEKPKYWFFIFGYPFSFSIGDALRGKPNKMLKYLFSPTNVIPTYLFKESKPIKWSH